MKADQRKEPVVGRWPKFVYGQGEEPDYRFSFANERTFLAWIRTALALIAAGVAVDVVDLSMPAAAQRLLAMALLVLGLVASLAAWLRWALSERAIRRGAPLPHPGFGAIVALAVLGSAVIVVASRG